MTTDAQFVPPRHHRGFLGLDREGWGPALAVLTVALALAVGLPVVNVFVPSENEIEPGTVLPVALGVSVVPPNGWSLNVSAPRTDSVVIKQALVKVTVRATPAEGSADSVLDMREKQVGRKEGVQLLGERETVHTLGGLTGLMRGFLSDEEQGVVAVVLAGESANQIAVSVRAEGPTDTFLARRTEVMELIRSIRYQKVGTP